MAENCSSSTYRDNYVLGEHSLKTIAKKRIICVICDYQIDESDESNFSKFNSNVRAFQQEEFKVWRSTWKVLGSRKRDSMIGLSVLPNCSSYNSLLLIPRPRFPASCPTNASSTK